MQYGQILDCLLREIIFAAPAQGHVYMLKANVSDGFYRISLHPSDIPNLASSSP